MHLSPFVVDVEEDDRVRDGCLEVHRRLPRVDLDRVALWSFSGGGLLAADHLDDADASRDSVVAAVRWAAGALAG